MKKRILALFLAMIMIFSVLAMTVSASFTGESSEDTSEGSGQTRTEEVQWYYRTYNGVRQMRLWSVTYARWITDWINVD